MASAREKYRLVRYNYYHAGRILHQMGNFHSSGIMLGYTIETIMKSALMEVLSKEEQEKSNILKKSHDVKKILNECRKHGAFNDIEVSTDFLTHINNNFQRYPSQMEKVFDNSLETNIVLMNTLNFLHYYDSLITDLDIALLNLTNDHLSSILYFTLYTLETKYSRDILYRNAFALSKFNLFSNLIKENLPERNDLRNSITNTLNTPISFYWDENNQQNYNIIESGIRNDYSCNKFKFQKWGVK